MTDKSIQEMRMSKLADLDSLGLPSLYLHISALSPTTRKSHAARHGQLYTEQEVRDFWADPANVEGCECYVTEVQVDEKGTPFVPGIVIRARQTYEIMKTKGYNWSK